MSRVITFSRYFPAYHPKKGQPTYFVEQLLNSIGWYEIMGNDTAFEVGFLDSLDLDIEGLKHHTIRAGNRWKVGDTFSPRVWSGKPYNSPQIIIAPDIEIVKIWDFAMDLNGVYSINGHYLGEDENAIETILAKNDGFSDPHDMFKWFMPKYQKPVEFKGQILCWNDTVTYP